MYEGEFFKNDERLIKWAKSYIGVSHRADPYIGFNNGAINYVHMAKDLVLLYQLDYSNEQKKLVAGRLHMLLFGSASNLRRNVFRVQKFFRPDGEIIWHSAIDYGTNRCDLPFVVANAWQKMQFEKYSKGGCFEMTFAALGVSLECMNEQGSVRLYSGEALELARKEQGNPDLEYMDVSMSHLRMLNPCVDEKDFPAVAEFTAVIESCVQETICGEKAYRIGLWSGPMSASESFPYHLLVSASHVEKGYVPRVGDFVSGKAIMYGSFRGEPCKEPTIKGSDFSQVIRQNDENGDAAKAVKSVASKVEPPAEAEKDDWKWIPRETRDYMEVTDHGGRLARSVAKSLPKFVTYVDYRKAISGGLQECKLPSRVMVRRIIAQVDDMAHIKGDVRGLSDIVDRIGVRQFMRDDRTGEYHLWCCVGSKYHWEKLRTHLLIALSDKLEILRYTFHTGDWSYRIQNGIDVQVNYQSKKRLVHYQTIGQALRRLKSFQPDDYIIVCSRSHASFVQAQCDSDGEKGQVFELEWQIHYLPWHFCIKATRDQVIAVLKEYDRAGVESVQTMLPWKWCQV